MGWNGSGGGSAPQKTKVTPKKPSPVRGLVAGLVVVALAAGAYFAFFSGSEEPQKVVAEKAPAPIKKAAKKRPQRKTQNGIYAEKRKAEYTAAPVGVKLTVDKDFLKNWVKCPGKLPMPNGQVWTFPPPKPGCTAIVLVAGHTWACDSEGNFVDTTKPSMFDDRFHNLFYDLVSESGEFLLSSCLDFTKDEITQALITPIQINEDDSPEVIEAKQTVASYKELLRDYIKKGGDYEGFVNEMSETKKTERVLRKEAMNQLVNLLREGEIEAARQYRDKVEEFLTGNGYYGLRLPENWEEKLSSDDDE